MSSLLQNSTLETVFPWIWHNLCNAEPCDCANAAPRAYAMPTLALVQRRPSCPCSAYPIVMTFTHWAHPTHFLYLLYQHNYVQNDARYGFGNLVVLKLTSRIAVNMQNTHRVGGNQICQNSAARYRIPSA